MTLPLTTLHQCGNSVPISNTSGAGGQLFWQRKEISDHIPSCKNTLGLVRAAISADRLIGLMEYRLIRDRRVTKHRISVTYFDGATYDVEGQFSEVTVESLM